MSLLRSRRNREFAQLRAAGWTVVAYGPGFRRRSAAAGDGAAQGASVTSLAARLFVTDCPVCVLVGGPFVLAEAERLAGTHDDLAHGGEPTTVVRPADGPARERAGAA
jgi:hypothetical protein